MEADINTYHSAGAGNSWPDSSFEGIDRNFLSLFASNHQDESLNRRGVSRTSCTLRSYPERCAVSRLFAYESSFFQQHLYISLQLLFRSLTSLILCFQGRIVLHANPRMLLHFVLLLRDSSVPLSLQFYRDVDTITVSRFVKSCCVHAMTVSCCPSSFSD